MKIDSCCALGLIVFTCLGCATESSTPPTTKYLVAGPAPQAADQVELLKGTLIQLRSGDLVLQAQAQQIKTAVGVQFYVINLSEHAIRLQASNFSLRDTQGKLCAALTVRDLVHPARERAAQLVEEAQEKPDDVKSADTVVNPGNTFNGGSTDQQLAKTLRQEANQLEKNLESPFVSAWVPSHKKVSGILYFQSPIAWPVIFQLAVDQQQLCATFYAAISS